MSKKVNWAEVDKRIRERRPSWTQDERKELAESLAKLPDLSDKVDYVEIPQPALAPRTSGDDGEQPN